MCHKEKNLRPFKSPLNNERIGYEYIVVLLHPFFLLSLFSILDSNNITHNEGFHPKKYKILTMHSF
jgi:hypothetical protein